MSAAVFGAIGGAALGGITNIIGLRSQNNATIGQITREGNALVTTMRAINQSRDQLDRELGTVLSENALTTAKNMATAKVLMSTSGTVGGTTTQVSKQAYVDQIRADADTIAKARNQEISLLNQEISKRIEFRNRADALRSNIKSPTEAFIGNLTSMISGATQGASLAQGVQGAMSAGASSPEMTSSGSGTGLFGNGETFSRGTSTNQNGYNITRFN